MTVPPAGGRGRYEWVDVAKALSIVLVVAYHVGVQARGTVLAGVSSPWVTTWLDLNAVLTPVRMPLFFLVSGLLAAGAVRRPWGAALRGRLSHQLWPYALWTVPFGLVWVYAVFPTDKRSWFSYNLEMLPLGGLAYWYLYALALFFVVAKLGRRAPGVVLVVSGALLLNTSTLAGLLGTGETQSHLVNVTRWSVFGFWFFLGCYARPLVVQVAAASTPVTSLVAALVFGWSVTGLYFRGEIVGTMPVVTLLGLVTGVLVSVQLARLPLVARLGSVVGSRTLVVYLVHPFVIQLSTVLMVATGGSPLIGAPLPVQAVWIPFWTVSLVAAAVGFDVLCRRVGPRWLLDPPGWLVGRERGRGAGPTVGAQGPDVAAAPGPTVGPARPAGPPDGAPEGPPATIPVSAPGVRSRA
ncbi:acyltransferase family protein [Aquipuribacter sp. MA13-6]|uniref:acyltransferase family protein n=1 Tax=unclassified Aquipuribacter TaxID=2635084 RepID=UPI003EEA57AB